MNPVIEMFIACLLIAFVVWCSIKMLETRILAERELVYWVSSVVNLQQLESISDEEFREIALRESNNMRNLHERTIAVDPFNQDSYFGRAAYIKRFKQLVEFNLRG